MSVFCIGAHCDDIEIGCGGTLLELAQSTRKLDVTWVVLSSDDVRAAEATASMERVLKQADTVQKHLLEFRNSFFPYEGDKIKEALLKLRDQAVPDLVLTHQRNDAHQDHRTLAELTWNLFRDHLILEYEIPKYDGDMGLPSCYVPLSANVVDEKCAILMECYASQRARPWFTEETFRSLMRIRGIECNSPSGYAEAFYAKKLRLAL